MILSAACCMFCRRRDESNNFQTHFCGCEDSGEADHIPIFSLYQFVDAIFFIMKMINIDSAKGVLFP